MRISKLLAAAALSVSAVPVAPAKAAVVTMTFDEVIENVAYGLWDFCGADGNVGYCDPTKGEHGDFGRDVLLGDGGLKREIRFRADPDTYFTPLRLDILNAISSLRRTAADCGPSGEEGPCGGAMSFLSAYQDDPSRFEPVAHEFLTLTGYRNGAEVAALSLQPQSGGVVSFGAEFTALDELVVGVDMARAALRTDGYVHGCVGPADLSGLSCARLRFDNLEMQTFAAAPSSLAAAPAPVPAPSAGWLLGGALVALRAFTGGRRRIR